MASFPHKQLVKISTPRTPDGILWRDMQRWGQDDPRLLVWIAPTAAMNPSIDLTAYRDLMDPARFAREFEAQFSDTTEEFLSLSMIERCVAAGVTDRSYVNNVGTYRVAIDAAAGGSDHFTCAVTHREPGPNGNLRVIHDFIKGWKTGERGTDLDTILAEVARIAKSYCQHMVYGDRYGGSEKYGLIATALRRHEIGYDSPKKVNEDGTLSESYADKSVLYAQLQNLVLTGNIEILDRPDTPLVRQLTLLQRTPGPQRDKIDHGKGGHDDFSNALALAAYVSSTGSGMPKPFAGAAMLGSHSRSGAFGSAVGGTRPAAGLSGQHNQLGDRYGSISRYARRLGVE
jgi:hypothetical protein